ncbi:Short-chain dehydrogenase/reductase SDR like protein [Aduncisulcus paluster]|uniref:Short-chain dehydrogenase/reductase SDR like protein n=1 Tax=Aduncisulcus paluster TaxID=2918883 RepID=A0ABQ5KT27_9EUKA|nr:Short-chain dehydrogenase/reductase SDR like protein [Aduncisulcus paluster]
MLDDYTLYPPFVLRRVKKASTKRYTMDSNSWAFVSGGSGGIGSHISAILATCGIPIIIFGRNIEKLAQVALRAAIEGVSVRIIRMDVVESSSMVSKSTSIVSKMLFDGETHIPRYIEIFDRLLNEYDIRMIYLNAGGGEFTVFESLSHSVIQNQIDLNYTCQVHMAKYFMRKLSITRKKMGLKHVGNITFTSSILGEAPLPLISLYSSNKHAITGLARALYSEYINSGIDIGCGCPGTVSKTSFYKRSLTKKRLQRSNIIVRNMESLTGSHADDVAGQLVTCAFKDKQSTKHIGIFSKGVHLFQALFGWKILELCENIAFGRMIKNERVLIDEK